METLIGLLWFLWMGQPIQRRIRLTALGLLAIYTIAYGAHLIWAKAPDCNCLSRIAAFRALERDAQTVLTRNGVLIGVLVAGALMGFARKTPVQAQRSQRLARQERQHARAFTLVETILVIAIVGLLLALTVPQLRFVRQAAQRVKSLSNLRRHVQIFSMYGAEHKSEFPFFMHPEAPETIIRGSSFAIRIPYYFYGSAALWRFALARWYDNDPYHESTFPPAALGRGGEPYYYSNNFVATPEYWRRETRLAGTSQYRPIRWDQVRRPDAKGLFLDTWSYTQDTTFRPPPLDSAVLVGFVGGAARSVDRAELAPSYAPGPPGNPDRVMGRWPVVHTVGGVEAADVP